MTGLYNGLEFTLLISFILLLYTPIITVLLLRQVGLLERSTTRYTLVLTIATFLLTGALTLFSFRMAPYVAVNYILLYATVLTLLVLILKISSHKQKNV